MAAVLHVQGISEGFLSTLGAPFLDQLYRGIAQAPGSGVFVAERNGAVLGFLAYAEDVRTCYRRVVVARWPLLAAKLAPSLLRPAVARKVIETLAYPFRRGDGGEGETSPSPASGRRPELLSMAVSAEARGLGVGKRLVARLDERMRSAQIDGYYVVTHATDERSNGFYRNCGFALERAFRNHGKPMHEYYKELSP